ncbi:MAG: hypothetical protein K2X98_01890 [Alphaproteobacteria bacterium]|nr:hypothetical protein [Alphaproteobacteria bacterium]
MRCSLPKIALIINTILIFWGGFSTEVFAMDNQNDAIQKKMVVHLPLRESFPKDIDVMHQFYQVAEARDGDFYPSKEKDNVDPERDGNILCLSFEFKGEQFTAFFNDSCITGQREFLIPIHIKNRYFTNHFYTGNYPKEVIVLDNGFFKGIYNNELSVIINTQ